MQGIYLFDRKTEIMESNTYFSCFQRESYVDEMGLNDSVAACEEGTVFDESVRPKPGKPQVDDKTFTVPYFMC